MNTQLGDDLPEGFALTELSNALTRPTSLATTESGTIFVGEQSGRILQITDTESGDVSVVLDIQDEVLMDGDRGLLGLALDPHFDLNHYLYTYYTVDHESTADEERFDAFARLARYTLEESDSVFTATAESRLVLLGETFSSGVPACFKSHNGGKILFGTDGSLLLSTGDAANYLKVDQGGQYPECFGPKRLDESEDIGAFRAQRVQSLAGKILRIRPENGLGYVSNPFFSGDASDTQSKVWAYGLRNPFRVALKRNGSADPADGDPGTLLIADVGWVRWEELQTSTGGENFGWPCYEGPSAKSRYYSLEPETNGCDPDPNPTLPQYYWHHTNPSSSEPPGLTAHALIAGDIYRGDAFDPQYRNALFYMDHVTGWIGYAHVSPDGELGAHQQFGSFSGRMGDMVYDPSTESFVVADLHNGIISRLSATKGSSLQEVGSPSTSLSIESTYPNPSAGRISVRVYAARLGTLRISIIDTLGRTLHQEALHVNGGTRVINLNLDDYTNGLYYITLVNEAGARTTSTFTVLH